MRLGLSLGYQTSWTTPADHLAMAQEADRLGFSVVWAAEAYGSDSPSMLAWIAGQTSQIDLGAAVMQIPARTPAMTAMTAATIDAVSGGRFRLGLGVSGPQVSEGWHGVRFAKPLARTREYVSIIRQVLAREAPVRGDGPHYPLPYSGPGSVGLGKPLRPITHPLRADLPIWLGAEGPKNVALAGEIADGWLAIYYSPRLGPTYQQWLADGLARPGARRTREEFTVAASCSVLVTDDAAGEVARLKHTMALYLGGMGAPGQNFHADVFSRMGYAEVVAEIGALFLSGRREEAAAAVPDELVADTAIIGTAEQVRAGMARWQAAGVDMLIVGCRDVDQLAGLAEAVAAPLVRPLATE